MVDSNTAARGRLFVITGPSGAGKGTVVSALRAEDPDIVYSISATTRSPRVGEQNGVHYYFVSNEEFERMIENGELLEYAGYVDNHYGTPSKPVYAALEEGKNVILEIETQGALQVKSRMPDAVMIFLVPPSFKILGERLRGRGTESEEKVCKRLEKAREEYKCGKDFDYIVINSTVDSAVNEIRSIMTAEACRPSIRKIYLEV